MMVNLLGFWVPGCRSALARLRAHLGRGLWWGFVAASAPWRSFCCCGSGSRLRGDLTRLAVEEEPAGDIT